MKIPFKKIQEKLAELLDCVLTLGPLRMTDCLGSNWLANRYLRPPILRLFGFNLGRGCSLRPYITMQGSRHNFSIGENSGLNVHCFLESYCPIQIGNHCNVGPNVSFINAAHQLVSDFKGTRPTIPTNPIVVEDFVWICAGVTLLPGVRVGRGSVVAAGSVVTKDVPPHTLVAGVPAKIIRTLDSSQDPLVAALSTEEGVSNPAMRMPQEAASA